VKTQLLAPGAVCGLWLFSSEQDLMFRQNEQMVKLCVTKDGERSEKKEAYCHVNSLNVFQDRNF
jgi:hypothetical protein